ncbi:MAG: hypothetical protein K0R26_1497 [Bacteroidota bacterium]|jgi:TM2 domain-containing membrane protein YozV|nr:hypothetical protein [Bacteroidota bacterium]
MRALLVLIVVLFSLTVWSSPASCEVYYLDGLGHIVASEQVHLNSQNPNPVFQLFRKKHKLNKKITAAVLAFPFPFGMVGLHRIYLGTKPHVPVVYIASLGGVFGVLPFIDFCAITFDKNFDQYRDNQKIFMWLKE